MRIRKMHHCESLQSYFLIDVRSQSNPKLTYEVQIVDPNDSPEEWICGCEGFRFRGTCAHQRIAASMWCGWDELEGPEVQTTTQRDSEECPRCGGSTWTTTEIIPDP